MNQNVLTCKYPGQIAIIKMKRATNPEGSLKVFIFLTFKSYVDQFNHQHF